MLEKTLESLWHGFITSRHACSILLNNRILQELYYLK
jgi:hypothetical protein